MAKSKRDEESQHILHTGLARVVQFNAITHLSRLYPSVWRALKEVVDNEIDANAKRITIEISEDMVVVTGDGSGMVPWMLHDDRHRLEQYLANVSSGGYAVDFEIREVLSAASLASLQWMEECIALSSKIPGKTKPGEAKIGIRGIGSLATYTYGRRVTYVTRPSAELFNAWGAEGYSSQTPTYRLDPPTADALEQNQLGYKIAKSSTELVDAFGSVLLHGTKVIVSELRPECLDDLRPGLIASQARAQYGHHIRNLGVRIVIIDKITPQGRQRRGGIVIELEPPEYKGTLVLQETGHLLVHKDRRTVPFDVEIYYDPRGTKGHVVVRRMKTPQFPIGELEAFEHSILTNGHFSGFVDFPAPELEVHGMTDEDLWDGSKQHLAISKVRKDWEAAVQRLIVRIREEVARADEKIRTSTLRHFSDRLTQSLTDVMRTSEVFRDVDKTTLPPLTPSQKKRQKRQTNSEEESLTKNLQLSVLATVVNEHGQPLAGIPIELCSGGQLLTAKTSGKSGSVSFGKRQFGKYRIRIEVPNKMEPYGRTEYSFELSELRPGYQALFTIVTGAEKPVKQEGLRVSVIWRPLDDPFLPWDVVALGRNLTVHINTTAPAMAKALEHNDSLTRSILAVQYLAAATVRATLKGDLAFVMTQESILFGDLYRIVMEAHAEAEASEAKRRRL